MRKLAKRLVPRRLLELLRLRRDLDPKAKSIMWRHAIIRALGMRADAALPEFVRHSPVVVFVCRGNIYRSPMAAALFERITVATTPGAFRVESAGLRAMDGRSAPQDACMVAREHGVSLDAHRATRLTASAVAEADLIVVMDLENEANLLGQFPDARGKLVLLGSFVSDSRSGQSIADPYGRGVEAIRTCYSHLTRATRALHAALLTRVGQPSRDPPAAVAKRAARAALTTRALAPLLRPFTREAASILMLHRFANLERGTRGHDAKKLEMHLEYLRAHKFHLSSLRDLVARLEAGVPPVPHTVVFTIDDGYADFGEIAAPLFSRFDCPATVFLVTGFVNGEQWLWYDAIEYLFGEEKRGSLAFELGGFPVRISWSTQEERSRSVRLFVERLKRSSTFEVAEALSALSTTTGRTLPPVLPTQFAPMSWSDVRHWSTRGVEFGAHTHTHPILSRTDGEHSSSEIRTSWELLRARIPSPVPVFCYPNGMPLDFGERERDTLRQMRFSAAVVASSGYCTLSRFRGDRFALPRLAYDEEASGFQQQVGGLERFKDFVFQNRRSESSG